MVTTYANTKHPERLAWALGIGIIAGLTVYVVLCFSKSSLWQTVRLILYMLVIAAGVWFPLATVKCKVDEATGELFTPENKKIPMRIADIDRITRVTGRRGRLKYLNIHEAGVRFVDVKLLPAQADALIAHLTRINPAIHVRTMRY